MDAATRRGERSPDRTHPPGRARRHARPGGRERVRRRHHRGGGGPLRAWPRARSTGTGPAGPSSIHDAFRELNRSSRCTMPGRRRPSRVVQLLEDLAETATASRPGRCACRRSIDAAERDPEAREVHARLARTAARRSSTCSPRGWPGEFPPDPRPRAHGGGARRTDPPPPAVPTRRWRATRCAASSSRSSRSEAATPRRLFGRVRDEPRGRRLPGVGGRTQAQHARGGAALDPRCDSRRRGGTRLRGTGVPAARTDGRRLRGVHRPSAATCRTAAACSPARRRCRRLPVLEGGTAVRGRHPIAAEPRRPLVHARLDELGLG